MLDDIKNKEITKAHINKIKKNKAPDVNINQQEIKRYI